MLAILADWRLHLQPAEEHRLSGVRVVLRARLECEPCAECEWSGPVVYDWDDHLAQIEPGTTWLRDGATVAHECPVCLLTAAGLREVEEELGPVCPNASTLPPGLEEVIRQGSALAFARGAASALVAATLPALVAPATVRVVGGRLMVGDQEVCLARVLTGGRESPTVRPERDGDDKQ